MTLHLFHSSVNQTDILGLKHNKVILHYNRGPLSQVLVDNLSDPRYKHRISARNIFCLVHACLQRTAMLASSHPHKENNEDNKEILPDSRGR